MSQFVTHEPCPQCGSSDNLGVWDDGHKWCFGCGYYIKGNGLEAVKEFAVKEANKNKELKSNYVSLPSDFTYNLPSIALTWLRKYGITDKEIRDNKIGWSETYGQLIYPCFDLYGNLLLYQGRAFNERLCPGARFHTEGQTEKVYHILQNNTNYPFDDVPFLNHVVVVEDMVSCIKVARHMPCLVLFGSIISAERLINLGKRFRRLSIWLDKDKAIYAVKRAQVAMPMFDDVFVIISERDPKEYNDEQLRKYLGKS